MEAVLVKNAERMMTSAGLLDEGIEMSFADGRSGLIPFAAVPELHERAAVSAIALPNPYELVIETAAGEHVEIPWDFARHYCDASYRPTVEAIAAEGRRALGGRVRRLRESSGLTQEALARKAGIGRITLVRLEAGERSPRLRTLSAIAHALDRGAGDLLLDL